MPRKKERTKSDAWTTTEFEEAILTRDLRTTMAVAATTEEDEAIMGPGSTQAATPTIGALTTFHTTILTTPIPQPLRHRPRIVPAAHHAFYPMEEDLVLVNRTVRRVPSTFNHRIVTLLKCR